MKNALIWLGVLVAIVVVVVLVAKSKDDKDEDVVMKTTVGGKTVRMSGMYVSYEVFTKMLVEAGSDFGLEQVKAHYTRRKCAGTGTVVAVAEVEDELDVDIDMVGDAEPEVLLTVVARNLAKDGKVDVGQTVDWVGNMKEIDLHDGVLFLTCGNGSAQLAEK